MLLYERIFFMFILNIGNGFEGDSNVIMLLCLHLLRLNVMAFKLLGCESVKKANCKVCELE